MSVIALHLASVQDLETRQDEVIRRLEELETRIAEVLAEHGVTVPRLPSATPFLRLAPETSDAA